MIFLIQYSSEIYLFVDPNIFGAVHADLTVFPGSENPYDIQTGYEQ